MELDGVGGGDKGRKDGSEGERNSRENINEVREKIKIVINLDKLKLQK